MKHFQSYWERSILLRKFDFLILGAGLIGKQISLKIKAKYPNARVGIVDRSPISYGASTRNAGFACFGSVSEIVDDLNHSPTNEVLDLLNKRYKGINLLVQTFGAENIGYKNTGSYEIFTNTADFNDAQHQVDHINSLLAETINHHQTFQWKDIDNFKMNCSSKALYNPLEGMINSGKLNETISNLVHQSGIIPLYGLNITSIYPSNNGYTLTSEDGYDLSCNQLIVANNSFSSQLLPELDVIPARGQIILTKPIEHIPFDGIFHHDKGYIYFRNIDNRILLGGARNIFKDTEQTYDFSGSDEVYNYLYQFLTNTILPNQSVEIDMHWSGIMAMGSEKLPIVKQVDQHLTLCVRMSGMGVALGPVLSDEVLAFFT